MRKLALITGIVLGITLAATGTALAADGNLACRTKQGAFVRCPEPTTGQMPVADTTQPFGMSWSTTLTADPLIVSGDLDIGNAADDTVTVTSVVDSNLTFDNGAARSITIEAAAAATTGDALTIAAGAGTGAGDKNGGNLVLRAGNAANAGTDGTLQLGVTNTGAITLGATGITTTSTGPVTVAETLTCNGDTDIGNAATDTVSFTSVVDTDVTWKNGAARTLKIQAAPAATAGDHLAIAAGDGTGAGDLAGGDATVRAGNAANAGLDGRLFLGNTNTSSVEVATAGIATNINGTLFCDEAAELNGATTTIGNAASDLLTLTAQVNSDQTFNSGANRSIAVEAEAADTAGRNLSVAAGAGGVSAAAAGGAGGASTFAGAAGGAGGAAQLAGEGGPIYSVGGAAGADGGGGGANGGANYVRGGNASAAGVDGILYCGDSNTSAVEIATAGIATTVNGSFKVDEATTLDGAVTLGNAAGDDVTVTGSVASDVTFKQGAARTLSVATHASGAGDHLTIAPGAAFAASGANGGNITIRAGAKDGAGTAGTMTLAATNTSAVDVAASGILSTFKGTVNIDEALTCDAAVTLGDNAADDITFSGSVAGNILYKQGAARSIGVASHASAAGNDLTIYAGDAFATSGGAGGALYVRAGNADGAGVDGVLYCGDSNTSAVEVGAAGVATTVNGSFKVDEATTLDGAVTLGNAAGDDVTVTGSVASDLTFKQGAARTLSVGSHASGAGNNLSVAAGAAFATSGLSGGNLIVRAGAKDGAGTDGIFTCGDANTSALNFGASTIMSTFLGTLNVDEAATFDGAVTLGNASTDDVTFSGSVAGNVVFKQGGDRTLGVAAHASAGGDDLTLYAADAFATSGGNGGAIYVRAGNADGAGTDGVLYCGDSNTSAVEVATAGIATTVNGSFKVDEATTLDGAVTLGNAAGDAITVTGLVSGNVTFLGSAAHVLSVDTDDNGAGNNFSIAAGAAFAASGANGGDLALNAGAKDGAGTAGSIGLGSTTASGINIGNATSTTTITGTITTPAGYPMVRKLTHRVQHTDLTDADGEEDEAIAGFPANSCPLYALVEVDTAFSGGTSTAVTVSVGDAGAATEVMAAITVFTGASGLTQGAAGANAGNCVFEASYSPIARFTCTTDTCLALTAGDAYIHLYYLTMAAVTP